MTGCLQAILLAITIGGMLLLASRFEKEIAVEVAAAKATREIREAIDRLQEWHEKYPDASLRQSSYARELLSKLCAARERRAQLIPSKRLDEDIRNYISMLLEMHPDYDPPPPEYFEPQTGLLFYFPTS